MLHFKNSNFNLQVIMSSGFSAFVLLRDCLYERPV